MPLELWILVAAVVVIVIWYAYRKSEKNVDTAVENYNPPPIQDLVAIEPTKCGCGRSPTGNCAGYHSLTEAEWAVHQDNPNRLVVLEATSVAETVNTVKPAKAKKAKTPKKAAEAKPAKEKTPKKPKIKIAK